MDVLYHGRMWAEWWQGEEVSTYKRKTIDVWRIYVNYGQGWEHECTEMTREAMKENRRAYRENCAWPVKVVRGREKVKEVVEQDEECFI